MSQRTVKSLAKGDTVVRLQKTGSNPYDYTVTLEDTAKNTEAKVTFPAFTDANQTFGMVWAQIRGEDDDLEALLDIREPGWE